MKNMPICRAYKTTTIKKMSTYKQRPEKYEKNI